MIGDILQPTHLLFVLVIALLVLGPKRLPEVGRALGRGLRDFRTAVSGDEIHEALTAPLVDPKPEAQTDPSAAAPVANPEPAAHTDPTAAATPAPKPPQSEPDAQQPDSGAAHTDSSEPVTQHVA